MFVSSSKVFISSTKCVHHHFQQNKCIHLLFETWFRNPPPKKREQKVGKKPWKGTETRHEMKQCKKTTLHLLYIFRRHRVVFCIPSSHVLLVYFSGLSLLEMRFYRNFFPISSIALHSAYCTHVSSIYDTSKWHIFNAGIATRTLLAHHCHKTFLCFNWKPWNHFP